VGTIGEAVRRRRSGLRAGAAGRILDFALIAIIAIFLILLGTRIVAQGGSFFLQILTFAVVGGTTNVIGPIVGAVFLTALPEIVRQFAAYRDVVNGVILILVIIFRPQGIVGRGGLAIIAPRWWTRWRTRERAAAAH